MWYRVSCIWGCKISFFFFFASSNASALRILLCDCGIICTVSNAKAEPESQKFKLYNWRIQSWITDKLEFMVLVAYFSIFIGIKCHHKTIQAYSHWKHAKIQQEN